MQERHPDCRHDKVDGNWRWSTGVPACGRLAECSRAHLDQRKRPKLGEIQETKRQRQHGALINLKWQDHALKAMVILFHNQCWELFADSQSALHYKQVGDAPVRILLIAFHVIMQASCAPTAQKLSLRLRLAQIVLQASYRCSDCFMVRCEEDLKGSVDGSHTCMACTCCCAARSCCCMDICWACI